MHVPLFFLPFFYHYEGTLFQPPCTTPNKRNLQSRGVEKKNAGHERGSLGETPPWRGMEENERWSGLLACGVQLRCGQSCCCVKGPSERFRFHRINTLVLIRSSYTNPTCKSGGALKSLIYRMQQLHSRTFILCTWFVNVVSSSFYRIIKIFPLS